MGHDQSLTEVFDKSQRAEAREECLLGRNGILRLGLNRIMQVTEKDKNSTCWAIATDTLNEEMALSADDPMTLRIESQCKGSLRLGSGCMRCHRCYSEMPGFIADLKDAAFKMRDAAVYLSGSKASPVLNVEAETKFKAALDAFAKSGLRP